MTVMIQIFFFSFSFSFCNFSFLLLNFVLYIYQDPQNLFQMLSYPAAWMLLVGRSIGLRIRKLWGIFGMDCGF